MSSEQPQERTRYVEVPVEREVIVKQPKIQYVDVAREVPQYEIVYVDKIVEIPKVNIIEKIQEVPEYIEKIRHVPRTKIVDVPHDVITYVPKVEVKVIEREVEVPGEIIQVHKRKEIIEKKTVHKYTDTEVPTVIAQSFKPHVVESTDHVQTAKLKKYVPYLVPVEVFVPVAVERDLVAGDSYEEDRPALMPAAQYNAQMRAMNPGLPEEHMANLYRRNADGSVQVYNGPGAQPVVPANHYYTQQQ